MLDRYIVVVVESSLEQSSVLSMCNFMFVLSMGPPISLVALKVRNACAELYYIPVTYITL